MPRNNREVLPAEQGTVAGGGALRVAVRADTPGAAISEQDFEILLEGSSASRAETRMWVFCGIAATALTAAGGIHAATNIWAVTENRLISASLLWFLGFLSVGVLFAILGFISRGDARRLTERKVYEDVVSRIRGEIAVSKKAR